MDQPEPQEAPVNQEADIPNLNSMNSLRSFDSIIPEQQVQPSQVAEKKEQEMEELQVVHKKVDKGINQKEIMRMFNEQLERDEKQRQEIEKRRMEMRQKIKETPKLNSKRSQLEQKKQNKEQALQQAQNQKSMRLIKKAEPSCRKYRTMFKPSIYDTKMNRYRFECKQKMFKNLCFGIEQMRQMSPNELSEYERSVLEMDPYVVLKRLATVIDAAFVWALNKGDRVEVSREYRNQWETLLTNLKDENNLELKRKIMSGTFQPSKIALANELDFFTSAKREKILEKQKQYIAEFTVSKAIVTNPVEPQSYDLMQRPKMQQEVPHVMQAPTLKQQRSSYVNSYIDESSILQIEELLSNKQLQKMFKRLEEDIQGDSREVLITNFKEVFGL